MARRRNARRTWPDGSGCDQRPLDPCSEGCPGWGWFNDEEIQRCDDCRTFDYDEDAEEHVGSCDACRKELRRQQGHRDDVFRYTTEEDEQVKQALPPLNKRRKWASWANTVARQSRYHTSAVPALDPDSTYDEIARWLTWNDPNGDYYEIEDEDGALAEIWGTLGEIAESDED